MRMRYNFDDRNQVWWIERMSDQYAPRTLLAISEQL